MNGDEPPKARLLNEVTFYVVADTIDTDPDTDPEYVLVTHAPTPTLKDDIARGIVVPDSVLTGQPHVTRFSTGMFSNFNEEGNPIDPEFFVSPYAPEYLMVNTPIYDRDPLNPFHHKFHNAHKYVADNPRQDEIWYIDRFIRLSFVEDDEDPIFENVNTSGWGISKIGGIYEESLGGLKYGADPIETKGMFLLQRVSEIEDLNWENFYRNVSGGNGGE